LLCSHLLDQVEEVCDRVAILLQGSWCWKARWPTWRGGMMAVVVEPLAAGLQASWRNG